MAGERDEQRRAKRDAWWRAAGLVRAGLEGGFDFDDAYPDETPEHRQRIEAAIYGVIADMERRGHR